MIEVTLGLVSRLGIAKHVDQVHRALMRADVCEDGLDFLPKRDSWCGDQNVRPGKVMNKVDSGIDKQKPAWRISNYRRAAYG
jgi:hypothetical protein